MMKKALNFLFVIATVVIAIIVGIWVAGNVFGAINPLIKNSILRWLFKFIVTPIVFLDIVCSIELIAFFLADKIFYKNI